MNDNKIKSILKKAKKDSSDISSYDSDDEILTRIQNLSFQEYYNTNIITSGSDSNYNNSDSDTDKIIIVEDINDIGLTEVSLSYKEN